MDSTVEYSYLNKKDVTYAAQDESSVCVIKEHALIKQVKAEIHFTV